MTPHGINIFRESVLEKIDPSAAYIHTPHTTTIEFRYASHSLPFSLEATVPRYNLRVAQCKKGKDVKIALSQTLHIVEGPRLLRSWVSFNFLPEKLREYVKGQKRPVSPCRAREMGREKRQKVIEL